MKVWRSLVFLETPQLQTDDGAARRDLQMGDRKLFVAANEKCKT